VTEEGAIVPLDDQAFIVDVVVALSSGGVVGDGQQADAVDMSSAGAIHSLPPGVPAQHSIRHLGW
jgi:hypothetical protein